MLLANRIRHGFRAIIFPLFAAVLFSSCGKREVQATFLLKKTTGETIPVAARDVYVLDKATVEKILRLRQTFKDSLTTLFDKETRAKLTAKGFDGPWSIEEINKLDQLIASISAKTGVPVDELQGSQRGANFANSIMSSALAKLGRSPESDNVVNIQSGRKALAAATDQTLKLLHTSEQNIKTDANGMATVKIGKGDFLFIVESTGNFVAAWLLPNDKLQSQKSIFSQKDAIFAGESESPANYFFTPVPLINNPEQLLLSDEAFAATERPFNLWMNVEFRNE
jgi:hypothetical protein